MEEGDSVVAAAPSLQPSAERRRALRAVFMARLKSGPSASWRGEDLILRGFWRLKLGPQDLAQGLTEVMIHVCAISL
jgi:hypothetical protein